MGFGGIPIRLPDLFDVNSPTVGKSTDELVVEISKKNPRGWCTIVLVNSNGLNGPNGPNSDKRCGNMGWFYFISDKNEKTGLPLVSNDELSKIIGYPIDSTKSIRFDDKEKGLAGSVLVIDVKDDDIVNANRIFDQIWYRLYPKIDAGPVNGSIPFQELFLVMSKIFIYSLVYKTYGGPFDTNNILKIIEGSLLSEVDDPDNLLNYLYSEIVHVHNLPIDTVFIKPILACNFRIKYFLEKINVVSLNDKQRVKYIKTVRKILNEYTDANHVFIKNVVLLLDKVIELVKTDKRKVTKQYVNEFSARLDLMYSTDIPYDIDILEKIDVIYNQGNRSNQCLSYDYDGYFGKEFLVYELYDNCVYFDDQKKMNERAQEMYKQRELDPKRNELRRLLKN
jgi:hypothetical protein